MLNMVYVEANSNAYSGRRAQWVIFPPLGWHVQRAEDVKTLVFPTLVRTQTFKGNRARWALRHIAPRRLETTLVSLQEATYHNNLSGEREPEWEVSTPYLVPLEIEEYEDMNAGMKNGVPQKALRAVSRELKPFGITIK